MAHLNGLLLLVKHEKSKKNDYDLPKLKFIKVDIATKKDDGKCYYVKGSVAQKHGGGGIYGKNT